jgi:hypothetical protein
MFSPCRFLQHGVGKSRGYVIETVGIIEENLHVSTAQRLR